ncbi:MAG: efflux RND transporter permease subunit [Nitrospira sp.]|nr:efflux RND transporter permease subunit [Nitrospira sp.]MCP9460799.1 efflux RND transporter permease subunit [Nitrospira sp.]MCP9475014.1 efflux RND transporter permease subunit [Nitrospira sp.]
MKDFNLSEWALTHRSITGFFMVLVLLGGMVAYFQLGQREDPSFTFRVMVVKTLYPGATAQETEQQVTDRLEKKIQELPNLDFIRSYSKPGESVIFVSPREDTPAKEIPELWYQVRKKVGDIRTSLPPGIVGPFFNDEFGDTYSFLYAFSGEGFSYAELKAAADSARQQILRSKDVEKVELIGAQDEKIYVEFSDKKLAQLGLDAEAVAQVLQAQNSMAPAGTVFSLRRNLPIRLTGPFDSVESVADLAVRVEGRTIRVSDFAKVTRGYTDPPQFKMRFNGKDAVGLGVTMHKKGDVLKLGKTLETAMTRIEGELPVGLAVERVADQSRVVNTAIGEFLRTFFEALGAVLLVSFTSLGFRAGSVVGLTVPLVLAGTLLCMWLLDMEIHRISLGALILGLGLLVDDAMIAIEMMARKLEEGWDRLRAATFAYRATAFPMLTGTLITIAGFLPVGLARSQAGEYTVAIFQVMAISLSLSWIGAVVFTPYLGFLMLKTKSTGHTPGHDLFDTPFYNRLRRWVDRCVERRKTVIIGTVALFGVGVATLTQVPEQFFPLSNRPEVIIDLWLPEGSAFAQTEAVAKRMEALLAADEDVVNYASYIGGGSPRFFLLIVQQLANTNLAEFVVMTRDNPARERVMQRIRLAFATDFPEVRGRAMRLNVGPPMDYPLLFRVFGEDPKIVRTIADRVAEVVRANPNAVDVNDDWHDRIPSLRLVLDQDKARALGVSTMSLSQALQAHYTGIPVGQFREDDKLLDIVWRAQKNLRNAADELPDVAVRTASGKSVPLAQLVKFETVFEDGVRWRRNRFPAISVRADVADGMLAPDVAAQIVPKLQPIKDSLPAGYFIETGAAKEDAWIAQKSILIWIPLVVIATLILLMMQLQNLSRTFLVFVTAPLGVIGAAFALLLFGAPFGFVALLGIIALAGMIMRNAVILVDQIEQDEKAGRDTWTAIVESTVRRFRPILLTAAAAILAMIPLSRNDFFGPQAIAIMGGLAIATVLTVFFLPALYAAWFRVVRNRTGADAPQTGSEKALFSRDSAAIDGAIAVATRSALPIVLLTIVMLGGCTPTRVSDRVPLSAPRAWNHAPIVQDNSNQTDLKEWWRGFRDPLLNELITLALAANHDLRIATARVREANAMVTVAESALYPSVDFFSFGGREKRIDRILAVPDGRGETRLVVPTANVGTGGLAARWEVDIFGARRLEAEATAAQAAGTVEERHGVQVGLLAQVAMNYLELRGVQERTAILRDNIEVQRERLRTLQAFYRAGLTNEAEVSRQETLLHSTESALPELKATETTLIHRLSVLLGESPSKLEHRLIPTTAYSSDLPDIPNMLPASLLLQRPDLRLAQTEVSAAAARLGTSRADLFPKVVLSASGGIGALTAGGFPALAEGVYALGAGLTAPIFNAGRIRAHIAAADARLDQVAAKYEKTFLLALEDVENAFVAHTSSKERREQLLKAETAAENTYLSSEALYQRGARDYLSVLDAQRTKLLINDERVKAETAVRISLISLFRAFGGGWAANLGESDRR